MTYTPPTARRTCGKCRKRIYSTWAEAGRDVRNMRRYRNQRGLRIYSAKECGESGFHIGDGSDHAYRSNRG